MMKFGIIICFFGTGKRYNQLFRLWYVDKYLLHGVLLMNVNIKAIHRISL